ncbi:uncharacterized protein LOC111285013 [Durio zibethinus]|uniref:Uncharacterized protein LOC111285013 n=1 Tax=Durio zibethinus TaxID=66656 RepID=A0A6P5XP84_DURZI|nr:uncharacterized protein LOC111285013 [Durio zibethinus]
MTTMTLNPEREKKKKKKKKPNHHFRTKERIPCIPYVQSLTRFPSYLLSLSKVKDFFPPKQSFLSPSLVTVPLSLPPVLHAPQSTEEEEEEEEKRKSTIMKGASKIIMGATLVMVVSLAIVLALILLLLAELYCSLLLRRRRQLKHSTSGSTVTNTATAATTPTITTSSFPPQDNQDKSTSRLSSFYAQGVLHAPRNFLFPEALPYKQNQLEKDNHHQVFEVRTQESNTSPHQIGIFSPTSPLTSFATSPNPVQEISIQVVTGTTTTTTCEEAACGTAPGHGVENFVYISNPIYDNDAGRPDTPFETPDTSPSRLENSGSSGDDEKTQPSHVGVLHSPPMTPPLSPMKKLPAQACSVSLRDARSLATSGSDSNSNNGLSSSSSGSPCTSPSW